MEVILNIAKHTRQNFIKLMDGLSIAQLNVIPQGFSNNIAWNFAHIIAAQQILCYVRAGVPTRIPMEEITRYQKGSRPESFINEGELNYYKEKAFTLLNDLREDTANGILVNYQPATTAFGVTLNNIDEATAYFCTHDNLHFGYAMALKRAVLQQQEQASLSGVNNQ